MGIVMKIIMIVALVVVGLAFGGQPLIGYTYGARDKARLKKVIAFALQAVVGTSVVLALGLALFARQVVHVFLEEPALIEQGVTMLYWQLPAIVFMGIGLVLICTFQATGKGLPSLMLSLCRQGIVYALALAVLPLWFGYTGVIAAQLAADIVTVVIAAVLYRISLAK
jgi:Na+-driven multidrug efflux pump